MFGDRSITRISERHPTCREGIIQDVRPSCLMIALPMFWIIYRAKVPFRQTFGYRLESLAVFHCVRIVVASSSSFARLISGRIRSYIALFNTSILGREIVLWLAYPAIRPWWRCTSRSGRGQPRWKYLCAIPWWYLSVYRYAVSQRRKRASSLPKLTVH